MVCEPERVRPLYNILGAELHGEAGISLHTDKTRVWNRGGIFPAHVEKMGRDVWNCDGIKMLGTSLGTAHFVASLVEERIAYARQHDEGMWATVQATLKEVPGSEHELRSAEQMATLPMRMGRLGMRSASRCAPASDAPHMIHQRGVTYLGQVPLRPVLLRPSPTQADLFFYLGQSYLGQSYSGQVLVHARPIHKHGLCPSCGASPAEGRRCST